MLRKIWIVLGAIALISSVPSEQLAGVCDTATGIARVAADDGKKGNPGLTVGELFASPISYPAGDLPYSVTVGDFNGDGWQDLVTANLGSDDATVLMSEGDGTFAVGVSYPAGDGPRSVAVGDFDGDGQQDLVTANLLTDNVTVLMGEGDGTFAAGVSYPSGDRPGSVAVGDFDGDGRQDLVTANVNSHDATVLLGHGDGTFADAISYAAGIAPWSVAVDDLDGDGQQDLATAGLAGNVTVLLGSGDGTFAEVFWRQIGDSIFSVAVGDFDGDGRQDLVAANLNNDDVTVLLGHGDGNFAEPVTYSAGEEPRSVVVGDFDGNGHRDLVTANASSNDVAVLLNQSRTALTVVLEINPGSFPNGVNPYSRGVIPVAILGSATFDVVEIDVTTLVFGPGGAAIAHLNGHLQDVNFDGIIDLVTHYRTRDTGIVCSDESATLTGEILDGRAIEGFDLIQTVGCRETRRPAIWMKDRDRLDTQRRDGPANIERQ